MTQSSKSISIDSTMANFFHAQKKPKNRSSRKINIPSPILEEIFLRLPVKSLLQFKRVSESWLSIIESPDFAKAHLKRNKDDLKNHRLLANTMNPFQLMDFSVQSFLEGSIVNDDSSPSSLSPSKFLHQMVGKITTQQLYFTASCDGLVCVFRGSEFFVWNPCTGKAKYLSSLEQQNSFVANYGLSYDDSCDEYKLIVTLCNSVAIDGIYLDYEVQVCSTKTGSWKKIGEFHGRIPYDKQQVCFNGKQHWLEIFFLDDLTQAINIASLDLATEMFGVMELPQSEVAVHLCRLLMFGQSLSAYYSIGDQGSLYVMKEYGVTESWTKVMSINFEPMTSYQLVAYRPVYITEDGDQIILYDGEFVLVYNNKVGTFGQVMYYSRPNAQVYVESLISL